MSGLDDLKKSSKQLNDSVASIQRTLDNLKAGQAKQQSAKATGGSSKGTASSSTKSSTSSATKGGEPKSSGGVGEAKKK